MARSYIRKICEVILYPKIHWLKFARTVIYHFYWHKLTGKQYTGLQFGGGENRIKDFLNIDGDWMAACDVIADANRSIKFRSNSFHVIYSSHVFEHVPRFKTKKVLTEWHRVLKPGGKCYIAVPDLEEVLKEYARGLSSFDTEDGKKNAELMAGIIYGGQDTIHNFHYFGYSFVTLKSLLESVGFTQVKRFDRSKLEFCPFDDAALSAGAGKLSLNVEALKGLN